MLLKIRDLLLKLLAGKSTVAINVTVKKGQIHIREGNNHLFINVNIED